MKIKKKIVWEKWTEPEDRLDDYNNYDVEDEDNEDEIPYKDSYDEDKNDKTIVKGILTPHGIVPVNSSIGKIFNFWVGHTNFNITGKVHEIIERTEGVETLEIISRYRMRIGIAKLFKDRDVLNNINSAVNQHLKTG